MIVKEITVRNINTAIAFTGDPNVDWFVEVLESNLPAPTIQSIANGSINLLFKTRCLNAKIKLAFHTDGESALVEQIDDAVTKQAVLSKFWKWLTSDMKTTVKSIPKMVAVVIVGGLIWALIDLKYDTGPVKEAWKQTSLPAVAEGIGQFIESKDENMWIGANNHPIYESEAIKGIEEKHKLVFKDEFAYVGNGVFLMRSVIGENKVTMFDHEDAEDKCDTIDTYLPTEKILQEILPQISKFRISKWGDYPEWTSDGGGWVSDDYVIHLKNADFPDGAYKKEGRVYADADDVKAAARCMFMTADFED